MPWTTPYKERRVDGRHYFLTGPGSQWFPVAFTQSLVPGGRPYRFVCREQFMMAAKAEAFGDADALDAILRAVPPDRPAKEWSALTVDEVQATLPDTMARVAARLAADPVATLSVFNKYPRAQKQFGRDVRGFAEDAWTVLREEVVHAGSVAAAAQDPTYRAWLLASEGHEFVEGSGKDRIWGVGLDWADDRILDRANWVGLNLLGKANGLALDWTLRNSGFLRDFHDA